MPTYQYVCTDCGSDLEAVQSFSEASLTECPTCGGKLRKRFGAVGVVFKGSGFYRNDSRSDRPGGSTKSESSEKSESTTKSDTKSDSSTGDSKPAPAAAKSDSSSSSSGTSGSSSSTSSTPKTSTAA